MPPKRVAMSSNAAAATAAPIDTSIKTINAIEKQLQQLKPILYKKDQHQDASAALKQFHELHAQIESIYNGEATGVARHRMNLTESITALTHFVLCVLVDHSVQHRRYRRMQRSPQR
jgi:hypothetical protein